MSPSVVVYAQLPKPDGVREGSMPYTAWKCMGQQHGSSTGMYHYPTPQFMKFHTVSVLRYGC